VQPAPAFSPDGAYWWDGQAWRPPLSPDGRFRWTGRAWLGVGPQTVTRPTSWTRPLQWSAAAYVVVGTILGFVIVPLALGALGGLAVLPPDAASTMTAAEQANFRQSMQVLIVSSGAVGLVAGLALNVAILVGILKRWRWVFWYVMILGLLAAPGIVELVGLIVVSAATSGFYGAFRLPLWTYAVSLVLNCLVLALSVWMLVALRRYGTWACIKVPAEPAPAG
jgi:hypothetical protein